MGITGLITTLPREQAMEELARMLKSVSWSTPCRVRTIIDEACGVYIGCTEREGAAGAGRNAASGRPVLVFSGEELSMLGRDGADSTCLADELLEDTSFPRRLNGRFHGLMIDRRRGTAFLFNDRYGLHRLYYHESKEALYVAAEAKAILAVRPEAHKLSPGQLGEFIACGCALENRSLFDGIGILPGGSRWVFRNGGLTRKERYFDPREWESQSPLDPEKYYLELRDAFSQRLPHYFKGRAQIGMSLTGGLDTRMIMAWQKSAPGSLPCYSFGGERRECQDVRVARIVAEACNQPYQVVSVGQDFLSQFSRYAERAIYLTDGCVDVSRAPDLYLNEKAREIAPVRMTGLFGGELLRQVRAFKAEQPAAGLFVPEVLQHVREAERTYAAALQSHPVSFAVFKQAPWHNYGSLALEETQVAMRTPFLDNDLVRTVFRAPASALSGNALSLRLIADGNTDLWKIPTDRGVGGGRGRLAEASVHAFQEFLFKAEYGYDMGMPQLVARADHLLSPLRLERLFLGRHKIFHFRLWYRDQLARYVREMLLDPRSLSRPYLDRKGVINAVEGHLKGDRNHTTSLHKLLTLELIHRQCFQHGCGEPREFLAAVSRN